MLLEYVIHSSVLAREGSRVSSKASSPPAQQGVELGQEHGAIGRPWRMDEYGSGSICGFEQHAVGGTAAL
jgi:hypothetical protein